MLSQSNSDLSIPPSSSYWECLNERSFSHSVKSPKVIETHISCVLLTGKLAYKIKKPVNLGFVDYTTLEKRQHFCELEVELNRRLSPEIYLGVVPILKHPNGFRVGDLVVKSEGKGDRAQRYGSPHLRSGSIVDYAVKMRQFPQEAIIANRIKDPALTPRTVEEFGRYVARFHDALEPSLPPQKFAGPEQIVKDAMNNFWVLEPNFVGDSRCEILKKLDSWTRAQGEKLTQKFSSRVVRGMVRQCHGDLHLKNIIQSDEALAAFDGIEFNEAFQWIDVLSEIAFPVMDFWARGRVDLAWRLLNAYLEETGDYTDLDVLRFYLVYRAMVRAKVSWLNSANHTESRRSQYAEPTHPDDPLAGPWDKYLRAAHYFAVELNPSLMITHGFSGSGKSTVAMRVIEKEGGVRIRADAERHRLAKNIQAIDKYSSAMGERVYSTLYKLANDAIQASFPIVVDATFLKLGRRQPFEFLAKSTETPFHIINCDAPFDELCRRLSKRENDPSEADVNVLENQMKTCDLLTTEECEYLKKY